MTEPIVRKLKDLAKFSIAPNDSVKQIYLTGPDDGPSASVFYEVWDPQGEQPDNSHAESEEIFLILSGHGLAMSDESVVEIEAGDVLVLPAGSVHRIKNTSETERLYTVTIMANDPGAMEGGFANLVLNGTAEPVDDIDLGTILSAPIPVE